MSKKERIRLLIGTLIMAVIFCAVASIGWTKQDFTVTYYYGFDGKYETQVVKKGYVKSPLDPGRYGYLFDGWYYTDRQGNEIHFDFETERVTTDLELTAHWKPYETELYFHTNGGSCEVDFMLAPYGTEVTFPTPERTGYYFAGWAAPHKWIFPMTVTWENPVVEANFYACWSKFKPGTTFTLGEYEQNIAIYEDEKLVGWKKEPLEWIPIDKKDGKYLLVTKDIIDMRALCEGKVGYIHWADSELREWLNGEFYNEVFSDEEKTMICDFIDEELGTTDKVTLLSLDEVRSLYGTALYAQGTAYANEKGFDDPLNYVELTISGEKMRFYDWLTRSYDGNKNHQTVAGSLLLAYARAPAGLRPAIWVDASKLSGR